ncbi:MAG: hypothetical protein ACTH7W_03220 [Psychrobacter sp.]|uniref:hypothetical protein n=2 Tax=Moraxellaceae TaxID=468 RepID=UPI001787A501|nr:MULTISPECIES: hypothetical protein [unclassified Psychrobacter]MBE0442253.1 hypothetical protein [Psychrobacter sp. FME13]
MKKLIVLLVLSLTACSNSMNNDTISLLDYTTPSELSELGYTPDKVDLINRDMKAYFGYNRYDGHQRYKINNFDIIVNPNNPDELYVVQDGSYLLAIRSPNTTVLYKKGTKFPNLVDTSIFFDREQPFVAVANKDEQMSLDINLDGVDAVFEKRHYEGDEGFMNYTDLLGLIPDIEDVVEANIPNQQCEKVAGPFACCLKEDQTYQPYHFTYERGWEISSDNEIAQKKCNAGE